MSGTIHAQHYVLNKYAVFHKPVDLNYSSSLATFKLIKKKYNLSDPRLLNDGEILYQTIYLSNDPAQKGWFTAARDSYIPPTPLGDPAPSQGIAKVLKSKNEKFPEGSFISGKVDWTTHNIVNPRQIGGFLIDLSTVSKLSHYLSVFGGTVLTAYLAAYRFSEQTADDSDKIWLITGAAGGVGAALVQIVSKLFKPKLVLAVAGGPDKVKYVESLGPNVKCIDYKSESYNKDFRVALNGDLIDVFVDQVGGSILNKAIIYMKPFGKIVQCGAIAGYNGGGDNSFFNYPTVITKRLKIEGFVVLDDTRSFPKMINHLTTLFNSGKLDITRFEETVVDAIESDFYKVPELWNGLFKGINKGKYIIQVAKHMDKTSLCPKL